MRFSRPLLLTCATLAALHATGAWAQNWTGAESDDWATGGNWSTGTVPTAGTVGINVGVAIPARATGVGFTGTTLNVGTIAAGGRLLMEGGSVFDLGRATIGSGGAGHLLLTDSGTQLRVAHTGSLNIGSTASGLGQVDIVDGARVVAGNVSLGNLRGSGGLTIDGAGSLLQITNRDLSAAGQTGDVEINVTNGGAIDIDRDTGRGWLQLGSNGTTTTRLHVSGAGSQVASEGHAVIGEFGIVRAIIADQALLHTDSSIVVAATASANGELVVATGAVARGTDTVIGLGGGQGRISLVDGGQLVSAGPVTLSAAGLTSDGTLTIGGDAGAGPAGAGILTAPEILFGTVTGTLVFNHTDMAHDFTAGLRSMPDGTHLIDHIAGTTILHGDGAEFLGTTTVRGGQLMLAAGGSLGGETTVFSGATLGGTGALGGLALTNGAIISPGDAAGETGTLTLSGDVTFGPGAIYHVDVDPQDTGTSDLIHAAGSATLAGGSVLHVGAGGDYPVTGTWTILTADDGVSGTFAEVNSDFAYLDPLLSYDAYNVYLNLTRNDIALCLPGMSANQCATGTAVETTGAGSPVFDAVIGLDAVGAAAAFDQLSGEIHASARSALIMDNGALRDAVGARLRADLDVVCHPRDGSAPAQCETATLWGQGFGSWGRMDGDGNAAALDRGTHGVLIGADGYLGDWRLGVMAGMSQTDIEHPAADATAENYHLGIYGGTDWGALALRTGLTHSWHDIDTTRNLTLPGLDETLTADQRARSLQAFGELAYGFEAAGAQLETFGALAHVRLRADGFSEAGGDSALTVAGERSDVTFTTLGLRGARDIAVGANGGRVTGMIGWQHAFGDITPTGLHAFAGGDPFAISGTPIGRNSARLELGLELDLAPQTRLGVAYAGQFGSGTDHAIRARLDIRF